MAHWIVSDCDIGKGQRLHTKKKMGCVGLHIHVVGCVCVWNFETKLF